MTSRIKKYNEDGMRMTDCCGACSTFDEHGTLYCKICYQPVEIGEGDGSEDKDDNDDR
jgi:hypothetical protein|tara:strand:+ start:216 stop:389 length:174 start_codon:yes stop_codon:yes gene_type:complete